LNSKADLHISQFEAPEILFDRKLPQEFYLRECLTIARDLLGKALVRTDGKKVYAGIIVETEAYKGFMDAAAHSYGGKTRRNEAMFEKGGISYVYFTYGNHYCFNVVVGPKDVAHAVLIRAIEPLLGIDNMVWNRGTDDIFNLASGPGKLTAAFDIDKRLNGFDLRSDVISINEAILHRKLRVMKSKRIGISKNTEKLWRFYVKDNPFVSGISLRSILKKKNVHSVTGK